MGVCRYVGRCSLSTLVVFRISLLRAKVCSGWTWVRSQSRGEHGAQQQVRLWTCLCMCLCIRLYLIVSLSLSVLMLILRFCLSVYGCFTVRVCLSVCWFSRSVRLSFIDCLPFRSIHTNDTWSTRVRIATMLQDCCVAWRASGAVRIVSTKRRRWALYHAAVWHGAGSSHTRPRA